MSPKFKMFFRICIKITALALILFFMLPWVLVTCTGVTISGYDFATGRRAMEGDAYPIVFGLVAIPILIIILAFAKKSFAYLRTFALIGFLCLLVFVFLFLNTMENRGFGDYVAFTPYMVGMVLMYISMLTFAHYCAYIDKRPMPDQSGTPLLDFTGYKPSKKGGFIGIIIFACLIGASWFFVGPAITGGSTVYGYGRWFIDIIAEGDGFELFDSPIAWWAIGVIVIVAAVLIIRLVLKGFYDNKLYQAKNEPQPIIHRLKTNYVFWGKCAQWFAFISNASAAFLLGAINLYLAIGVVAAIIILRGLVAKHIVVSALFTLLLATCYMFMLMVGFTALGEAGFTHYFMRTITILIRGGGIRLDTLMTLLAVLAGGGGLIFIVLAGVFDGAYRAALLSAPLTILAAKAAPTAPPPARAVPLNRVVPPNRDATSNRAVPPNRVAPPNNQMPPNRVVPLNRERPLSRPAPIHTPPSAPTPVNPAVTPAPPPIIPGNPTLE